MQVIIGGTKHLHFVQLSVVVSTSSFSLTVMLPNWHVPALSSADFKFDGTSLSLSDATNQMRMK